MKIAIMQPYLFPYIGYFQLINAVNVFGIGDDVQYIQKGWINRNRILLYKEPYMFTFSIKKDSFQKKINERTFTGNFDSEKEKILRVLEMGYKKAPYYSETMKIINLIFESKEINVSKFIKNQLKIICDYLEINTKFIDSSCWQITEDENLNTEQRAIKKLNKLKKLGIDHFINPIGGKEIYNKDFFEKNKLKLSFLETNNIEYKQFDNEFCSSLSIIDVMMFNSRKEIKLLLESYKLL